MTQIKMNVKKREDDTEEKTEGKTGKGIGETAGEEGHHSKKEKKEVPLEKMTKSQLLEKVKEAEASAEKHYDLYVRSQAEMENMKRRFQREKSELVKFSNESLIKQLLPVMDNLEKAIAHSKDENSLDALVKGVELTLKGLRDTLEKSGLKEVKAAGEAFDPNFHEAMCEQEDDCVQPGTVIQEVQKGYLLNERLIRPAMVIVSKKGSESDESGT